MNIVYLTLNVLMLVSGQVLFKIGLEKLGGVNLNNAWKAIFNTYIIFGLLLYVLATLVWFVVLSRVPLSIAYPIQSIAYVLGILAAFILFNEPISFMKWMGMIIIVIGVYIISIY
ncbi:EamA family transporter [Paenibacillus durus]|uniref:Membrane protein n=1 Tax=Paenibacillus durus ATCC 35681 TaxID=1333534 RepID=A0A0F7FCN6_PAEDU|nr:EamA family transporter [Paenibacillus durus]AKG36508.1 membrane protein [Paenibacillus durus ATCC 35681]